MKKDILKSFSKFTGKHLCWSPFLIKLQAFRPVFFLKKETPAQVLSYEFCEIFKNAYFTEHLRKIVIFYCEFPIRAVFCVVMKT